MPSARSYRDDRDARDRAPPPLPSLPRRSETMASPTPPPVLQQVNGPPYGYYPPSVPALAYSLPPTQPEPPAMHKVWILDCKGCGTFLTNRAMKAVLLLRPNVPLYSTDALPANCGVFTPSASRSSRSNRTTSSTLSRTPSTRDRDNTPRTCECLTQTLSCHSCGASVGYMIVMPCVRCTSSSFSPPNAGYPRSPAHARTRATNGHRFVFHSSEVAGEERLYVPGEPGVMTEPDLSDVENIFPGPHAEVPDYVRTFMPPYTARALTVLSVPNTNIAQPNAYQTPLSPLSPNGNASPGGANLPYSGYPGQHPASPPTTPPVPKIPKLRSGDVVYWHHLATRGDLAGVRDDERSRASCGAGSGRHFGDEEIASLPGMPGAIWCAR